MTLQEVYDGLKGAKSARELLTDEVKEIYRAETDTEQRALIYVDLRSIAKAGKFTSEFDKVFSSFKSRVDGEEKAAIDWDKEQKKFSKDNVSIQTVAEVLQELDISVRYNQLLKEVEVKGLPVYYSKENASNVLPVFLRDYMKSAGYSGATVQNIEGCLDCIADRNRYNPVKEYLLSGTWDGTDRFPEIYRILGVSVPRYQMYIRKWFIQCVAISLNDDETPISAEGALVLQGEQGLAKTSFFRLLSPFPRWFVEGAVIDMRDKDSQIKALRGMITELGELDSTIKKEQSSLKAFITSPEDRIRMPYARNETRSPRRTSFCGTVNPKDYLKDETGSRRFWTVPITKVDKTTLFSLPRDWINQLWFQTYRMFLENPAGFRLTDDEIKELQAENRDFEQLLPYEAEILDKLDFSMPMEDWEWWSSAEVAAILSGSPDARKVGKAISKILKCNAPNSPNSPKFPKLERIYQGKPERLLPLRHFDQLGRKDRVSWGRYDELPL